MIQATINIDETANGQTIYCPELDKGTNGLLTFIQIYTIKQTDIDGQLTEAQTDLTNVQNRINELTQQISSKPSQINPST